MTKEQHTAELIGLNLKDFRERAGLTQEQLCESSGVPYRTIQNVEKGDGNPSALTVYKLTKTLGASIADVFGESVGTVGSAPIFDLSPHARGWIRETVRSEIREQIKPLASIAASPIADHEALSGPQKKLLALIPTIDDSLARQIIRMITEESAADQSKNGRRSR